jgi:hypothetical protein
VAGKLVDEGRSSLYNPNDENQWTFALLMGKKSSTKDAVPVDIKDLQAFSSRRNGDAYAIDTGGDSRAFYRPSRVPAGNFLFKTVPTKARWKKTTTRLIHALARAA